MNEEEKLVLAVDFGTQSLRVSIVNAKGEIKAIIKKNIMMLILVMNRDLPNKM